MLPPCLIFLDGDGPADPLIARERRYVFPGRQCLRIGRERPAEISRKVMYDSPGDSNGGIELSRRLEDQASDARLQLGSGKIPSVYKLLRRDFFPSFSATRAFTIFFTKAAGRGLSTGNCSVPFEVR